MRIPWAWVVGLGLLVLVGVERCQLNRQGAQLVELRAASIAAQAVADSSAARAARAEAAAAALARVQDSLIQVSDSVRDASRRSTAALSHTAAQAVLTAGRSNVTVAELRVVVATLVEKIETDSIVKAKAADNWLLERAGFQRTIAAKDETILDLKQTLADRAMAHAAKVAELQAQIPSPVRQTLEKLLWAGAGAGICSIAC